jgi:hypothetical protein
MSRADERIIKEFEKELDELKSDFSMSLRPIITSKNGGDRITLDQLLDFQQSGVRYFNKAEEFAGRSHLIEVHTNGRWATSFAETCHAVLGSLIQFAKTLDEYKGDLGDAFHQSDVGAYASLQRMVVAYLPDKADSLRDQMRQVGLPVRGFEMMPAKNRLSSDDKRTAILFIVGLILMSPAFIVGLKVDHPSPLANVACRGLFALGGSIIAMRVTGKLTTNLHIKGEYASGKIKATGAIAIFVILYLLSPSK